MSRTSASRRIGRAEITLLGAATVLLAWGWVWARRRTLPDAERRVFRAVNELPDALRFPLWPVMQLGNALVWIVAPLIALVTWRRPRIAAATFLATFGAWTGAKLVKSMVERGRPESFLDAVQFREAAPGGLGFVSGHTAIAFALATVVRPYLPRRARPWAFAVAAAVGVARMHFGAHLPADVLGGAGLGIACGLAANVVMGVDEECAHHA